MTQFTDEKIEHEIDSLNVSEYDPESYRKYVSALKEIQRLRGVLKIIGSDDWILGEYQGEGEFKGMDEKQVARKALEGEK